MPRGAAPDNGSAMAWTQACGPCSGGCCLNQKELVLSAGGNCVLVPAANVAVEVLDGECLAYHPQHARAIYLNPSAALVWGLCDGVRSADEICRMVRDGYPDAPTNLIDEVIATLAQLEEYGLLVRA
jgi:hypothetical protein